MFSYNVLRQHCSNILETFLKYVAATSCAKVFTTFPQRCDNVFETLEYDVKHQVGTYTDFFYDFMRNINFGIVYRFIEYSILRGVYEKN